MAKIVMQDVTLPFLRIEHAVDSQRLRIISPNGFAFLILGKTVIDEVPMGMLPSLILTAIGVRQELMSVNLDATATKISVMIPRDMTAKVLWPQ